MSDEKNVFDIDSGKGAGNHGLFPVVLSFGLFVVLTGANHAYAGGAFDYVGYTASSLVASVARELNMEKEVHIHRSKSDMCNNRPRCVGLNIVAPFEKSGFLEKAVIALAKPCAYSKVHPLYIKNPDLASAKSSPLLDGNSVFCGTTVDEVSIVLQATDSSGVFGTFPMTVVIKRNEKND